MGHRVEINFTPLDGTLPPSGAQKRILRVNLVNPVLEANFLRGGRDRLVIQTGAIQAQDLGLCGNGQFGMFPFQQG